MKIRVIGTGIRFKDQITVGALAKAREARKVLSLGPSPESLDGVEDLRGLYLDGAPDEENYRRILDRLVSDAREYGDVALLVPGHPRLGVTIVQWLERERAKIGYELEIHEGISSFDTLVNDLGRDPLEKGSVLLDVNRLLLFDLPMVPELDHFLYHVCSVGTRATHFNEPSKDNAIDQLKAKLLSFYPAGHPVELVSSSSSDAVPVRRYPATVGTLEELLLKIDFSCSLFIPGVRPRRVNRAFLARLQGATA